MELEEEVDVPSLEFCSWVFWLICSIVTPEETGAAELVEAVVVVVLEMVADEVEELAAEVLAMWDPNGGPLAGLLGDCNKPRLSVIIVC